MGDDLPSVATASERDGRGIGPGAGAGRAPRVVFAFHKLELNKGGLTKAWLRRVRLFAGAGWDVHVAMITPDRELGHTLKVLRGRGQFPDSVTVHRFWHSRAGAVTAASLALRRQARTQVPHWLDSVASRDGALVFADSPLAYPYLAQMDNPRAVKAYVVHLCHLSAAATRLATPEEIAHGPMRVRYERMPDSTMRAADRIIVLTQAQRQDFLRRWGADLPVEVIPHCADVAEPSDGLVVDPRLVVVLGRLDYPKRWDDALRAMSYVVREVPDARLVVYGDGDDVERLRGFAAGARLKAVTFAGYTPSPLDAMACATCVISTSRSEAMSLTLLESLSVGTPAIAYDVRYGPAEVIRDGVDGFLVPPRDMRGVADAVVRLLTEPGLRERMSEAAREVTSRFSREEHDRTWLDLGAELYEARADRRAG